MSSYKRTVKIKILDEVNCAIIGLQQDHIDWFYEHFARKAPNYFFNPRYKLGAWDGKIRYFHKTGKTYVYLLPQILPKLESFGYKLDVIDQRTFDGVDLGHVDPNRFAHLINASTGEPYKLRYYQEEAVNAAIDSGGGIVIAGTGAGKTIMCAVLADAYHQVGLETLVIVPSATLVKQTRKSFIGWELSTGEYSGDAKEINHPIVISTWQALQNNPKLIQQFDVVIVDECHGIKGQVLTELLNQYGKNIPYRYGFTGTLPKAETDAMAVHVAVGPVVYEIPAKQLMDEGYLAKMHVDIYQLEENFQEEYAEHLELLKKQGSPEKPPTYVQFKETYFPEWRQEISYLRRYEPRLDWITALIEVKRDMKKGNVFVLVDNIQLGQKLESLIDNSKFVYGKDDTKVREEIYDLFATHDDLVVIANVQIAAVGLDIPRIFHLVFVDIGKSFIRVIQSIGRGLRLANDKDFLHVTDIGSDLKYGKRHVRERIKYYREAEYPYKKHVVKYDE